MNGRNQIQITGTQFTQGLCTSDYLGDGGLGTSSLSLNLIAQPGVVRCTPELATTGASFSTTIIASAHDPRDTSLVAESNLVVGDNGTIYSISQDGHVTSVLTTATTSGYLMGATDMVGWIDKVYITRTSNVVQYDPAAGTRDDTWWTVTKGKSALTSSNTPHPMLIFENFMWIADGANLYAVDSALAITNPITLPSSFRILSLGIDPGTGLMMIGLSVLQDIVDNYTPRFYIALYDGYSSKLRRLVPIDEMPVSFRNVGGIAYVFSGNTVGAWTGNGVQFLRRLLNTAITNTNSGTSAGALPYKCKTASFQNTLLVVDGKNILAYGELIPGRRVWWPLYQNVNTSEYINLIANLGNSSAGSTYPVQPVILMNQGPDTGTKWLLKPFNISAAPQSGAKGVLYTNNINFERPVFIHKLRVFTTGITTTAGLGDVSITDEKSVENKPATHTFKVPSGTQYVFDFEFGGLKVQTCQPKVQIDTQAFGIVKMVMYYDVAE